MEMVSNVPVALPRSASSDNYDDELSNEPLLKKLCVLLCMPQNAPECSSGHLKLIKFHEGACPQTPLQWTAAGHPCSLLWLMTLPPTWKKLCTALNVQQANCQQCERTDVEVCHRHSTIVVKNFCNVIGGWKTLRQTLIKDVGSTFKCIYFIIKHSTTVGRSLDISMIENTQLDW